MAGPAGQPVQTSTRRWDVEDPQEVERSKGFRSVSVILRVIHTEAIVDQDTGESVQEERAGARPLHAGKHGPRSGEPGKSDGRREDSGRRGQGSDESKRGNG